ncbi:hypothetical protein RhiirA1_542070 [Rhizophagus irregularis]|uniref:Uncharacterized protein n=1 Tax=Rhizophagus irregularis TaxID=588596 RepID=A0A2N0QZK0_9GLOM|nr:hypothetical protein RhiirA1_542070 [Rhizophagus irregularis]
MQKMHVVFFQWCGLFSPYESEIHQNVRVEVRKTEVGPWFTLFPYDFTAPLSQPQAPSAFTRLMDFRIDFQNKREDIRVILLYNHIIQLFQRCVGWLGVTMESDLLNGLYGYSSLEKLRSRGRHLPSLFISLSVYQQMPWASEGSWQEVVSNGFELHP